MCSATGAPPRHRRGFGRCELYRAPLKRTGDKKKNYWLTLFLTDEERARREVREKFERIR
jgi:hypothetical protein